MSAHTLDVSLPPITAAGLHDIEGHRRSGSPCRFSLSLPEKASNPARHPLILVLHYGGQPTRYYGRPLIEQLFGPALHGLSPILVAPESLGGRWHEAENESFVLALLDTLIDAYPIDPRQVIVAGYSMGALGSWYLARNYPERFAAAIPVAGVPADSEPVTIPIYTFATPNDEIFAIARFEELCAELTQAGVAIRFERVSAQGHYDVGAFAAPLQAVEPWLRALFEGSL